MNFLLFSFTFFMVWWVVLFAVLPFWVRTENVQKGNAASAPEKPYLLRKFLVTTVIALAITGLGFYLVHAGYIPFEQWIGRPQ